MATYKAITQEEMEAFLFPQGFRRVEVPGAVEFVYAKAYRVHDVPYSLRVYSSVVPAGVVRDVGADSIKVQAVWRESVESKPQLIGTAKRVHRVEGWKENLQARIDGWMELLGPVCQCCKSPTKLRQPKAGQKWKEFYGCVRYPACKGTGVVPTADE